MKLNRLVELVRKIQSTSKKGEKIALLADFLRQMHGRETEIVALYLTGNLSQGRIGIGGRMIEAAWTLTSPAGAPLTLFEVDDLFDRIAADHGPGLQERKIGALRSLLDCAGES